MIVRDLRRSRNENLGERELVGVAASGVEANSSRQGLVLERNGHGSKRETP